MVELVRNPGGVEQKGYRRGLMKSVVAKGASIHNNNAAPNYSGKESEKDALARAEADNQMKQKYLHQKTVQLWNLLEQLRELGDTQFLQQDWCYGLAYPGTLKDASSDSADKQPLLKSE